MAALEIERKFLIEMPGSDYLDSNAQRLDMVQTYLNCPKGITARVRKVEEDGSVKYIYTSKQRITAITCIEDEKEVTPEEYNKLLETEDKNRKPIIKTRYNLPYEGHIFEIDVYPFWTDKAVMEVELESEDEKFTVPPEVTIIKDVTGDVRYKNFALATGNIPED